VTKRRFAARHAERASDPRIDLRIPDNSVPLLILMIDSPYGNAAEPPYRWLAFATPANHASIAIWRSSATRALLVVGRLLRNPAERFAGKFVMPNYKPATASREPARRRSERCKAQPGSHNASVDDDDDDDDVADIDADAKDDPPTRTVRKGN
jgi:hypothetical protein